MIVIQYLLQLIYTAFPFLKRKEMCTFNSTKENQLKLHLYFFNNNIDIFCSCFTKILIKLFNFKGRNSIHTKQKNELEKKY